MPLLIIAGMHSSVTNRNRGYVPQVGDWTVSLVPSRDNRKPDLQSCWTEVLQEASKAAEGAHIFAYHHREDEYPEFNSRMHDSHRLVWMERDTLGYYGSDKYTQMIKNHLNFERTWRDKLRPRGVDAPGILPERSFSPKRCKDMWSRMRSVTLNKDCLERILTLVQQFRETHYGKGLWEDDKGLQFKVTSDRHGSNPPYGRFKFTYKLPEGFHYDVRGKVGNRGFTIVDAEGQSHRFGNYTNIDPHGSIRGGH